LVALLVHGVVYRGQNADETRARQVKDKIRYMTSPDRNKNENGKIRYVTK